MNKQIKNAYRAYKNSRIYCLSQAYKSPSVYKLRAWERCQDMCFNDAGQGLKVIGYNSMKFSAGYEYSNSATGELMFCYITADNVRRCIVEG